MTWKLLAVPIALAAALPATAQQLALAPGETLLEVQAEGQARLVPDQATITAGVVSTGATAREATDANARQMTGVIAALRGAGIAERDIKTQQINLSPRFARSGPADYEGQAQITGYVARNSVMVTIRRLPAAPTVIAAAFEAGANSVYGPNLGTADPDLGQSAARKDAIANARAEAEEYAAGLGMRIARVIRVSERGTNVRPWGDIVVRANAPRVSGSEIAPPPPPPAPPTPIAGGELVRTTNLWIDFALVPR